MQRLKPRRPEPQPHEAVPTTRLAFSDPSLRRIVEPGAVELWAGPSCDERETSAAFEITGPVHLVTAADARLVTTEVEADTVGAVYTDAL